MLHKEVALRVEHFYHDEEEEFRISSEMEMLSILQGIADQRTRAALFYDGGQSFILTSLLDADEHGLWLDVGPFPAENKRLLLSDKITFVSVYQHVKIQFTVHGIESGLFENGEAFYTKLPDYLLRIQRRESFRVDIPSSIHVKCIIPVQPETPGEPVIMHRVPIVDISGGGIGLLCNRHEADLLPNKTFQDCRISISNVGTLTETIEVRFNIDLATRNNEVHERVGCRFVHMDNQTNLLLQRHIARLQSESMARHLPVRYSGKYFKPTVILLGLDLTGILDGLLNF